MLLINRSLLAEGRIVVRRAHEDEKLTTLDDEEHVLTSDMLVIADAHKPMALAGIMGGAQSEINDATNTVLLESACFESDHTRLTARATGIATESSYRFERGVNIGGVDWASRRAANLMIAHANAVCAPGVIDVYPTPVAERTVTCRTEAVSRLLGVDVQSAEIIRIFKALELEVVEDTLDSCTVRVPTFRPDLEREVDLIEEVARIHGLDQIPSPAPRSRIIPGADDSHTRAVTICRASLAGLGLQESMNYSLVSEKMLDLFGDADREQRIVLPHPISTDQSVLRTSLIPQMVATLGYNRARQLAEGTFFEFGRVFFKNADGTTREEQRIALGLMGPVGRGAFDKRRALEAQETFSWLKGIIESLAESVGAGEIVFRPTNEPYYEQNRAVSIEIGGKPAGHMGVVKPVIRAEWRLQEPVVAAELRLTPFLKNIFCIKPLTELAAFPPIERDMALVVKRTTTHADILQVIRKNAPKVLENVELFDIFEGKNIEKGRKSMAYALTYRSAKQTLTDAKANMYHDGIKEALKRELDVEIREG